MPDFVLILHTRWWWVVKRMDFMSLMCQAFLKVSLTLRTTCMQWDCKLYALAVMQRFKDRELIAPVTPPSQVFTSLAAKPPADDVSVCAWLWYSLIA